MNGATMSATLPVAHAAHRRRRCRPRGATSLPLLLVPALALAVLPFVSLPTWVTLTVAGLAMGMMIFIMASGLTLVFGLMSVLNFGHGAFVSVGAFTATLVLLPMRGWLEGGFAAGQPRRAGPGRAGGDAGHGRARLGLRAGRHHAGLRPAPEADPGHHGRHDRRPNN